MSIPSVFKYVDEMDFIQKLLIPLLDRLGFHAVANYHGKREYGKDLVFGEVDKFGHFVYHGLQAKYVGSISQADSHDLVRDAEEAFSNEFLHPTQGTKEYITFFYVVNGGSIADNARENFYNIVKRRYGPMVRMFDGNEIIAIERRATEKFGEVIPGLTGLLREVRMNRARMIELADSIRGETVISKRRLRDECSCEYIKNPSVQNDLDVQKITDYSDSLRMINERLVLCEYHGKSDQIGVLHGEIVGITSYNIDLGDEIEGAIQSVMKRFGSLIGG